jgi:hypothetical protein
MRPLRLKSPPCFEEPRAFEKRPEPPFGGSGGAWRDEGQKIRDRATRQDLDVNIKIILNFLASRG